MTWEELKKYLPDCLKQTDRIEKCLNQEGQIKRLQEQLLIAKKALKEYTIDKWNFEDEYYNYPLGSGGWCHAEEALKEIKLVEASEKEVK